LIPGGIVPATPSAVSYVQSKPWSKNANKRWNEQEAKELPEVTTGDSNDHNLANVPDQGTRARTAKRVATSGRIKLEIMYQKKIVGSPKELTEETLA
jgi:hypothetical protein